MLVYAQRDFKVADGIKITNQLPLQWRGGGYSGLAGGPNVITMVLKSGRGREKRVRGRCDRGHRSERCDRRST